MSRDLKRMYFMAFTRNIDRPEGLRTDRVIVLGESARGVPPPIHAWFPIGEAVGHEFIYDR
jgi:hypothetical protein